MGTEESRPIAVPCAKEMSSASSSLHWSPQWRELLARIRFGRCPNVNSQGTSWRATVTTHFGLHDDVKMLCGTIMRDSETFQEMECAKTNDQQWNRTLCDSFNVRTATPTPSMTGTALTSVDDTTATCVLFSCFSMDCNSCQPEQA